MCAYIANERLKLRLRLKFKRRCLKQEDKALFTPKNGIKFIYCLWIRCLATRFKQWFYLKRLFFGSVSLIKNADPDQYNRIIDYRNIQILYKYCYTNRL